MFKDNFSRYEFKFPMTFSDMRDFERDIGAFVSLDEHAGPDGVYTISSIYMDNDALDCYNETINGAYFRQKVRLRVYGEKSDENAKSYLEIKGKINGLVVKRRVEMVLRDAMAFIDDCVNHGKDFDISAYKSTSPQILSEIRHVIVSKNLKNVNVVSYERKAYVSKDDPDLRITFDYNVRTRGDRIDLTEGTDGILRLQENIAILELKTSKNLPKWLVDILGGYGYRNQTFSKYCSHYRPNRIILGKRKNKDE